MDNAGNPWVSALASGQLFQLNPSTGAVLQTISVPSGVYWLCAAGPHIWVGGNSPACTKYLASTGAVLGTYTLTNNPEQLVFDGTNIWSCALNSNVVDCLNESTGVNAGPYSTGAQPFGAAFDGTHVWVTNNAGNTVSEISTSAGQSGTAPTSSSFPGKQGQVAYDSSYLFLCVAPNTWVRAALSSF
jgi:DNA-binding beta-propeller fold protein YncE